MRFVEKSDKKSIDAILIHYSGISTASSSGWSYRRPRLKVETYGHHNRDMNAKLYRSCTAPLDVLKIRLQLQIYSLSDPLSNRNSARVARYSIGNTFKKILHDEGITVGSDQAVESAAGH